MPEYVITPTYSPDEFKAAICVVEGRKVPGVSFVLASSLLEELTRGRASADALLL